MERPHQSIASQLSALDTEIYRAIAASPTPALDRLMRSVSTTANYSVLWGAIAAALATRPGRTRRAAINGMVSIGVASLLVNQGAKRLAARERPARLDAAVPETRHVRMPGSTSFPSGHSASALAFASAVGDELPITSPVLHTMATIVAYSRVHTGVHYPADVLVGGLIGLIVGNSVAALSRWRSGR